MQRLLLLASLTVAVQIWALPNRNRPLPPPLMDFLGGILPNTSVEVIQKAMQNGPSTLFKCVGSEQLEQFRSCETEMFAQQRRRGPGGKGGRRRGNRNKNCTTEEPREPEDDNSTTVEPLTSRRKRLAPIVFGSQKCFAKCVLQKFGAVDDQGNVTATQLDTLIDSFNLSADQKTAAKAALQTCLASNLTLPTRNFNLTGAGHPLHRFRGPFNNHSLPIPQLDPACKASFKALICTTRAILQNGCVEGAVKTAALYWSSSEDFSESYESDSSEEVYSEQLRQLNETNEALEQEDALESSEVGYGGKQHEGEHHQKKHGKGNVGTKNHSNHGQHQVGPVNEQQKTGNQEESQDAETESEVHDESKGKHSGAPHSDGLQQKGSRGSNGGQQRGPQESQPGSQSQGGRQHGARGGQSGNNGQQGDQGTSNGQNNGSRNSKRGGQSAALVQAESSEELEGRSQEDVSSQDSSEYFPQHSESPGDHGIQLPGANTGYRPSAGRPGISLRGR